MLNYHSPTHSMCWIVSGTVTNQHMLKLVLQLPRSGVMYTALTFKDLVYTQQRTDVLHSNKGTNRVSYTRTECTLVIIYTLSAWWLLSAIVHIQCRHVTFVHLYIYVYMCVGISSKLHFWCLSLSTGTNWYKIAPTTDNTLAVSTCIRHTHCTCILHQSLLKESANSSVLASPPPSSASALSLQKYLWQPCCSYMEEQQHHWSCTMEDFQSLLILPAEEWQ